MKLLLLGNLLTLLSRFERFVNYSNSSTRSCIARKSCLVVRRAFDLADARLGDLNRAGGRARLRADGFDSLDDIHTLGDAAENNVLTVQPAGGGGAQEELGTVRARAGVGHGEDTRTG